MITLKELAAACDVSIATISNILNNKGNVSEETKLRVMAKIKETGYKPNYMARGLRASKTNTIGLIIEDLTLFSTPSLVEGIMSYLEEKNYKTIMENLRLYSKWGNEWYSKSEFYDAVRIALDEMLSINVDGIIYVAGHTRVIDSITSDVPVPVVMAYALPADNAIPSVVIDDYNSAIELCDLIISKGYKNIGFIVGEEKNHHTVQRLAGCRESFKKAGLPFDEEKIVYSDWSREGGYKSCVSLFQKNPDLDSVFCFNDFMAAGVYDYLKEKNLTVQKDIGIVGFDNRSESDFLSPPLTTTEIPLTEIGIQAAKNLLEEVHVHLEVPCKMIERNSI